MKQLIIFLLLCIAVPGKSQVYKDTTISDGLRHVIKLYQTIQYDTIPVLMLYCDTLYGNDVLWAYGYEVYTDTISTDFWQSKPGELTYYPARLDRVLISRLNSNKQPLRKSIIIWQSIKL